MRSESLWARLALAAAIVGGVSYLAADYLPLTVAAGLAWKGSGVGLLAVYAALRARSFDGWLLAAVMALGAAGDVLLGAAGFVVGGGMFLLGHLVAIWLYLRNRRPGLSRGDWVSGLLLIPATVTAAWLLPADRAGAAGVAAYALGLSAMAASAGLSRFPRGRVALGALMFLVSDLLIFARAGPLAGQATAVVGFLVWSLYFAGQALICLGVTRTLAADEVQRAAPK
ncbi:lysoplasmalogenase family protein [Phenylobacterium sp.]|uniref:lysoplasmalogenase family protein n=1 Tax=Phenylobacterium sp. TaxID=1871053 RepID=UPI002CE0AFC6|nr:lysoplasmalogenase family protein [Phenylobacterium sp.]HLZ75272.1 lysoplasmalogenase family protein [Phenylobacterium sp.]